MPTKLPVDRYLKADLFQEIGLTSLTQEDRVSFLEAFGNVIQQRLSLRVMKELSEDQKDQLETLLTNHPDDVIGLNTFLESELPNFKDIAEEEVAKYKKELISRFNAK